MPQAIPAQGTPTRRREGSSSRPQHPDRALLVARSTPSGHFSVAGVRRAGSSMYAPEPRPGTRCTSLPGRTAPPVAGRISRPRSSAGSAEYGVHRVPGPPASSPSQPELPGRRRTTNQNCPVGVVRPTRTARSALPDADAVLGVEPEAVAGLTSKASWNSARLRTMLARNSGGLCGSVVRYCIAELLAALGAPHLGPVQEQPLRPVRSSRTGISWPSSEIR